MIAPSPSTPGKPEGLPVDFRQRTRAIYVAVWRSNLMLVAPFIFLLLVIGRPWSWFGASILILLYAVGAVRAYRRYKRHDDRIVEAQGRLDTALQQQAELLARNARSKEQREAAKADYDEALAEWTAIQDRLRLMWSGDSDQPQLISVMREALNAMRSEENEPDLATRLHRRAEALRRLSQSTRRRVWIGP